MAFPNSLSGAIELPGLNPEEVIRGIERALERERAPTDRQAQRLEFRVPFSRSGWNVLAPITDGVVEVATRGDNGVTVSYRVTFTRIVWFATVATGALLGPVVLADASLSPAQAVGILILAWSWLTGGNYVLTRWRWPASLARAARQLPERKRQPSE